MDSLYDRIVTMTPKAKHSELPGKRIAVPETDTAIFCAFSGQIKLTDRLKNKLYPAPPLAYLKEKEDEVMALREKLKEALAENHEKDRVAANDSKLIMQLSKKLETLLMDNEDLR